MATSSDIFKRTYSDEELDHIYALGRLHLENGEIQRANVIFLGLNEIAPTFGPGWLGSCYVALIQKSLDAAVFAARQAVRVEPDRVESLLFLVTCLLSSGDYNSAGTYLGEINEKIDRGDVDSPNIIRFYKSQLARYQLRSQVSY